MKQKRGQTGIVIFFVLLFIILVAGFILAITTGALTWASAQITPTFTSLGMVDNINLSQAGQYSIGAANTVIQTLPWVFGFLYIMALVGSVLFILMDNNQSPMWMGAYFVFMVFLILISIVFSNAYQDIYNGGGDLGTQLQSMTILSFLILNSPYIFTVIGFITGIYLFSGRTQNVSGGYGYNGV